jgi:hypothetical protein
MKLKSELLFLDGYFDIECYVSDTTTKRCWKTLVWLDRDTLTIVGGDEVEYSPSVNEGFDSATWIPNEVNTEIEKSVARAKESIRIGAKRKLGKGRYESV